MSSEGLPNYITDFLAGHIDSVLQLEVLLMLYARRDRSFTAADAAGELRIDRAWTESALSLLAAAGVLEATGAAYRYAPRTPQLDQTVMELATEYHDRRVTIISLIFSKPTDPIRQFTDAFRFRKEGEN